MQHGVAWWVGFFEGLHGMKMPLRGLMLAVPTCSERQFQPAEQGRRNRKKKKS
jgi:hypothetical protein